MNPVQLAASLSSLQSLVLMLRKIQEVCNKQNEDKEMGKLTEKVRKIMHVPDGDKSLMLSILSNKQFFAAHSIVHQIENFIHAGDSIEIQKSILKNMKSSKLSKDTFRLSKSSIQKKSCLSLKCSKVLFLYFLYGCHSNQYQLGVTL